MCNKCYKIYLADKLNIIYNIRMKGLEKRNNLLSETFYAKT